MAKTKNDALRQSIEAVDADLYTSALAGNAVEVYIKAHHTLMAIAAWLAVADLIALEDDPDWLTTWLQDLVKGYADA